MQLHRGKIAALVIVGVLAIGLIAVLAGGDEPSDKAATEASSTGASAPAKGSTPASQEPGSRRPTRYVPEPGTPEATVYDRVDNLYEVFEAADENRRKNGSPTQPDPAIDRMVKRVCDLMSQAALKQLQATSPALDEDPHFACLQSVGLHLGKRARSGGVAKSKTPAITAVRVDGDNAVVTLKFPGYPPRSVRMVDEDGRWKIDAIPAP